MYSIIFFYIHCLFSFFWLSLDVLYTMGQTRVLSGLLAQFGA